MAQWSSKLGFIFASIGAAVGLGNIWRFPVQVQQNGGGAYLIPYLLVVIFFGITLMIVEIGGGRKWGVDVVSIFEEKNNGWMGWVIVLVVTLILSYYMVIQGWIIAFVPIALTGFSVSFEALSQTYWTPVLFVISLAASGAIVMFDIEDGIERVASVLIPLVFLLILGLVVYAFSLPNYGEALNYYLRPDLSVVTDVGLWSAAFGQAFFSLALGHGILLTYGTYLGKKTNVTTTSIIITAANFLVAFFVGLVIFPFIFAANVDPANIEAGRALVFKVLPEIFDFLSYGRWIGALFFTIILAAALSSSIALMNVGVDVAVGKGMSRKRATGYMLGILFILGLPSALSYTPLDITLFGERFLDFMDSNAGHYGLPIGGLLTAVGFTWMQDGKVTKTKFALVMVKYVLPVILIYLIINRFGTLIMTALGM